MEAYFPSLRLFWEHTDSSLSHTSSAVCLTSSGDFVFLFFTLGPRKSQTSSKISPPATHKRRVYEWGGRSYIPGLIDPESKGTVSTASPSLPTSSKDIADSRPINKVNGKNLERKSKS